MQPFELKTPKTLEEAVAQLPKERTKTSARAIAGGQDLLTVMKDDIESPSVLVEIEGLGMSGFGSTGSGGLTIGATTTIQDIADDERVGREYPALREAARSIASPQIRSRATIGGNLNQKPRCPYYRHSSVDCYKKGGSVCLAEFGFNKYAAILGGGPSFFSHPSDMAPVVMLYGGRALVRGPGGERTIDMHDYYVSPEEALDTETVLAPDELVHTITLTEPMPGMRSTYVKYKERASYDFALSAAAVGVVVEDGTIRDAKVVLGGVAPKPWPSPEAANALIGKPMEPDTWRAAGKAAVADAFTLDHNGYKVHLVQGVLYRALEALADD